jgi:hypothetical protein
MAYSKLDASWWICWEAELTLRSLAWTVRNGKLYVAVKEVAAFRCAVAEAFARLSMNISKQAEQ